MAFDPIKKQNKMENNTEDLIGIISDPNNLLWQAALDELKGRIILENDPDDIVEQGVEVTRGGIRPYHSPHVPA